MGRVRRVCLKQNLKLWGIITSAWLGLAVGLAIRTSGMLYIFGCLVLPALVEGQAVA